MKKILLSVAGLSLSLLLFGQVTQDPVPYTDVKSTEIPSVFKAPGLKGGGDIFWTTTFDWEDPDNPVGWSLPDGWTIVDETDYGAPWMWRNDTLGNRWTNEPAAAEFETPEDGFLAFPADEYYTRDDVVHTGESYHSHITTPPIDCSEYSSVVVNLRHKFRLCCNEEFNLIMQVTNDDGVHWANYDLRHGIGANNVLPERFRIEDINISDVAAGLPAVMIRFLWQGPHNYYWMIDDVKLMEAYENELVLEDYWANFYVAEVEDEGHINYWPLSQYGNPSTDGSGFIGEYSFRSALLNNGVMDQYNVQLQMTVLRNGEQVYQELSDATEIWALDRDTVAINENKFLADDYGDYQFNYEAISENAEEVPANNIESIRFTLNDTLMHRADFSAEASANSGGWVGGSNSGDLIGNAYPLYNEAEVNSISAYIVGGPGSDYDIESTAFIYHLMKYMDEEEDYVTIITSDMAILDSSMLRSWVTLPVEKDGESEFLEPGTYVTAVEMLGEGGNGMSIGWDKDTKHPGYATYLFMFDDDPGWFNHGKLTLIGMNLNEEGGPTEAPVTFNVDMNAHIGSGEFNPDIDFVDVAGTFNEWNGSDPLSDEDGDGIYSITIEGFTVAAKIEYKYRINANWDTSEFPDGGPNRQYTVRYWNNIQNIYNNGETVGVEEVSLVNEIVVFPNPAQGDFTVRIQSNAPADYDIKLIDIQGHAVYQKKVSGVSSYTEKVENDFSRGVYFLTVNDGNNVTVRKLILK